MAPELTGFRESAQFVVRELEAERARRKSTVAVPLSFGGALRAIGLVLAACVVFAVLHH
jgi:hypothetical protein